MEAVKNLIQVSISPSMVYERVKERPVWWIPVILLIVTTIISLTVSAPLYLELSQQQLQKQAEQMSPEQLEQAQQMINSPFAKGMTIGFGIIGVIIAILIQAGLLHFIASALGGAASFGIGLATVAYAQVPIVIQQIVQSIYVSATGRLVKPGLSALLSNDQMTSPLGAFLSRIDIFSIWSFVLIAIGFSVTYKMSKGKSAAMTAGYWVLSAIVAVVAAAIGNSFGGA